MQASRKLEELRRSVRREVWTWSLTMLALALVLGWGLVRSRDLVQTQERSRLADQALVAERNLTQSLQGIYAALQWLRAEAQRETPDQRSAGVAGPMQALARALPGVHALQWLDGTGHVLASNRAELLGQDLSGLAFYRTLRDQVDAAPLHVSEPYLSSSGVYSLNLSLALRHALGGFEGLVSVTLDPAFFSTVLGSVRYADDVAAVLVHGQGGLLVDSPSHSSLPGLNVAQPASPFALHLRSGLPATVMTGHSPLMLDERLVALRTVKPDTLPMDQPLVVAVSRPLQAVLASWQRLAWVSTSLYAALLFASWLVMRTLQGQRQRMADLAQEQLAQESSHAEQLALALSGGDLALWDLQLPSGRSSVNERWFTLMGLKPGEIVPDHQAWQDRLHPNDAERVQALLQAHVRGETDAYEATYRLRHADGHWIWVHDRARVVQRDAQGAARRMVGTHMDVSAAMQAQDALRRSEESLAITLMSIGDAVIATDEAGRITRMNGTAVDLTGWPAAEALGRPLGEVFCILDAKTRLRERDPVARVLEHGHTVGLANGTVLLARDGREHQIADSAAPIRAAHGAVVGVVLVFTDVTEQYQTLQALRQREAELSNMADALPGPVARLDREGRFQFVNAAYERWFGLRPAQLIGRRRTEVMQGPEIDRMTPYIERALAGELLNLDASAPTVDGPLHAMVTLVPDRDAHGVVQGCYIVVADITERKRAEDALRLSERKSRALLEALRSGVVVYGPDAAVLDANASACRILGLTLEQMRSQPAVDSGGPWLEEDGSPMAPARLPVNQVLASGEPLRDRVLGLRRADLGHDLWALCNAFPLHGEAGELREVVVTFAEFTARKLAEDLLRLSESRLRMAGRLARLGSWRFELQGLQLWLAPEAAALIGADPACALSAVDALQLVTPADRQRWRDCVRHALQSGEPFDETIAGITLAERPLHLRVLGESVRDAAGKVIALQGAMQDVSEQMQAAQALRTAQQELSATLAAVPDLLFDVDLQGCIHNQHSPRSDLLLPPERFLGRTFDEMLPGDAAAVVSAALRQAHAHGYSGGLQYVLPLPGGPRWFELSVARKAAPADQAPRFIVLARDITERKQSESERGALERQVREVQKMESIGTLAGGIAHDFNNILAAILGNVALAREDLSPGHPAQVSLDQINRAGMRARSLVQQILTFSRREPHELIGQSLRPVLEETLALLRATLPAWVDLHTELTEQPLAVLADATQLQQVVMNLCTNAWQALPEGRGRIEVGLQVLTPEARSRLKPKHLPAGACAHLWVRDDGCGMEPAQVERIFDPFFTTKAVGYGTGLGLSVVHGIVRGHGGVVQVQSVPGHGSTFHVVLPLVQALPDAHGAGMLAAPQVAPGSGQHVVYVDDDQVMVVMVQRLLQRAGYAVTPCDSPLQLLQLLDDDPALGDVVVSDFNMPGLSGLDLARELARRRPGLPVIISSGYLTDDLREQALAAGVKALMKKENTLEELADLVQQVLAARAQAA